MKWRFDKYTVFLEILETTSEKQWFTSVFNPASILAAWHLNPFCKPVWGQGHRPEGQWDCQQGQILALSCKIIPWVRESVWRQLDCLGFGSTLQILFCLNGLHSCKFSWVQGLRLWNRLKNVEFNCCSAVRSGTYLSSSFTAKGSHCLWRRGPGLPHCDTPHMEQTEVLSWAKSSTHYLSFRCF